MDVNAGRTHPGAVTPEEIMAYVDGEAPEHLAAHIRSCPHCIAQASILARDQGKLHRLLYRFDCPSPHELGEYELGVVSPEARTQVAAHVLECPRCTDELQALRSFMAPEPMPQNGMMDRLRRSVATLLTQPGLAYAGLRGAGDTGVKTYRAGDVTITISSLPGAARGRVTVAGLVTHESAEPEQLRGEVRLAAGEAPSHTGEVDEMGNFFLEDVAPGSYQMELQFPEQVVLIEDLQV
jgi:anti-sigma factor RsiW